MFEKLSMDSLTTTMTGGAYRLWDTAKGYFAADSGQDDKDNHQAKTQDGQDDEKTSASFLSTDQQDISWSMPNPKKLMMFAGLGLAYYTHQAGYHHNYDEKNIDISYAIDGMNFTFSVPFQTTLDWSFAIPSSAGTLTQFAMLYGTSIFLSYSYQYNSENFLIAPLSLMALSNFLPILPAQNIETEFLKVFGGNLGDYGNTIKITSTGDMVVAGYTQSFGAGSADALVAKFYANGSLAWARTLGGSGLDYAHALALTPNDDIVVAGQTNSFGAGDADALVAKFYANGSLIWACTLGGSSLDNAQDLALTPNDDIVMVGGTSSFGAGNYDALVAKLYANGSLAWARTLGGSDDDRSYALALTSSEDIIVAGYTDSFGDIYGDMLVTKLYASGSLAWARTLGGSGTDNAQDLALTPNNDIVLIGNTYSFGVGNGDVLIAKLYANGSLAWAQTLGGTSYDIDQTLTLTPADDIVLTASTTSFGAGSYDALIAKLYANGSLIWARTLGGSDNDRTQAIALTPTDNIVVTGYTSNIPNVDIFVAKLNSNGTIPGCNLTRTVQPTILDWSSISNNVVAPSFISLTAGILQNWTNINTQFITPQLLNLCFAERNISMNNSFSSVSSMSFVSNSSTTLTSNNSPSTQTLTPTTVSSSTPTSMVTPSSIFAPMPAPAPAPSSASVNLPPVLTSNYLIMTTGGTMTYSALNINAMDDLTPAANLLFIVSQVSNGHFQTSTDTTPIYSFTQQQLQNREIQFVHDGSNNPPSYQVHVYDGSLNSLPQWAAITFNNNAIPVLLNNQMAISTGQTVILNNVNLNATDADNLVFTVSDIQHGFFANVTNPNVPITTFTQGDINAGVIQFTHDGSNNYPSYYVSVSDGTFNTPPSLVNINFNNHFIPIILNNQLTIVPEQITMIGIENIGGLDLNGNSNDLTFTVSNLSGGQFELVNNPGVSILQFTQQDIIDGNVQFTPDAVDCINPTSPSYNLQVSDGSYSTLFNIASIDYNTYTTTNGCVVTTSSEQDNTALYAGVGVTAFAVATATLTLLSIFAVKQRHQREKTAERINEMDEMAQYAAQYKSQPGASTADASQEVITNGTSYMNRFSPS